MAFALPAIGAISGALGIASAAKGLFGSKEKAPAPIEAPTAPTAQDAMAKAAEDAKKRRLRMSTTDVTKGSALVPSVNVEKKSLLGA